MQNINLYLPEFRPRIDWLAPGNALAFAAFFAACLLLFSAWTARQNHRLAADQTHLQAQLAEQQTQLAVLRAQPVDTRKFELERQIASLRSQLASRRQLLEVLDNDAMGNKDGFSAHWHALASANPPGVALSHIQLLDGGLRLRLQGDTRSPQLLPDLLGGLKAAPGFLDTRLGNLMIERQAGSYRFVLADPDSTIGPAGAPAKGVDGRGRGGVQWR